MERTVLRGQDLDKYSVPKECRLDLTPNDIQFAESLKEKAYVQKRPAWVKELDKLLSTKQKAEIQAFTSKGFQYLTETYLPRKLREGDWI